ncbi:UNVERIFIED_CONTAM: hypothetical protein K2H54_038628 [Gekko kuhli]
MGPAIGAAGNLHQLAPPTSLETTPSLTSAPPPGSPGSEGAAAASMPSTGSGNCHTRSNCIDPLGPARTPSLSTTPTSGREFLVLQSKGGYSLEDDNI